MADPENQTLRVLRDIRGAIESMDQRLGGLSDKVDKNQEDLRSRLDSPRQAINGESVLGRYAAAEVEERLESLEKRIAALESRR
jgi:chaperonin cofactor prefoldin